MVVTGRLAGSAGLLVPRIPQRREEVGSAGLCNNTWLAGPVSTHYHHLPAARRKHLHQELCDQPLYVVELLELCGGALTYSRYVHTCITGCCLANTILISRS